MAVNYRLSDELEDAKMITGMCQRVTKDFDEAKEGINTEHIYENCNLISGIFDQYAHIRNTLKAYGSMAIQEDYTGWKENDFHREVAKLLLIE